MVKTTLFGPTSSFYLYLVLASFIAFAGLTSNSVAAVLGSMLLAPFASPIISANAGKLKDANLIGVVVMLFLGVIIAVAFGNVMTRVSKFKDETSEMKSRGEWEVQKISDVISVYVVPIICGIALSVAFSHKDIVPIAGVSLAVSILPPLTTAGIYSAQNKKEKSLKALKLGLINLVLMAASYTFGTKILKGQINTIYWRKILMK